MKPLSYLLPLLLGPSAAIASQAKAVSEPLTTDSLVPSVANTNPGGPILTFTSTSVATTDTASATTTTDTSLSSESTTTTALHPSEPTGISGGSGTGTGTGTGASASATSTASEGAAFAEGGPSRVALVVALGAGLLGWVAF
ncbi:hypothetical protein UCDDA912_g02234 [Diaporthe ampelina]|uniref:Uncharacterized protein n=1 Tax=Diaporthe ampelina TaxID=1214573 RepID=A0A0G2FV67_9PEZI|nr:hypothetical protein UCDDA912_g02234 [Diaporthe ampelina]